MHQSFFVTGTGTGIGKTVISAWLALHLKADYWKPVQSGMSEQDSATVRHLAGLDNHRIHPETYCLQAPLSPHEAARREDIHIRPAAFRLPHTTAPLIVEGAGGVLVPLDTDWLMVDLMVQLALPVILVASTTLGTINHTLLSLEALRARQLDIAGVILSGPPAAHNHEAIQAFGHVDILAHLPWLDTPDRQELTRIPLPSTPFWNVCHV